MSSTANLRIGACVLGFTGAVLFCLQFYADALPQVVNSLMLGCRLIPVLGGYFIARRLERFGIGWALAVLIFPFIPVLLAVLGKGDGDWQDEWEGVVEGVTERFGGASGRFKALSLMWTDRRFRRLVSTVKGNAQAEELIGAVGKIGMLGDRRGVELLVPLKKHPSAEVRKAAFNAMLKLLQADPENDHKEALRFLEYEISHSQSAGLGGEMAAELEAVAMPELLDYLCRDLPKTEAVLVDVVTRKAKALSDQQLEMLSKLTFRDLVVEREQVPYTGSDSDFGYYRTVEKKRYYVTKPSERIQDIARAEIERRRSS